MVTHRQPVVVPSGVQAMSSEHPSYALHGIAQQANAQHRAVQQSGWDSAMAANPYGHFSRPSTTQNPDQFRT